uniref:Kringle domain-containing protein n=2 Tax=Macrostomum lignano TaxID=282301 RepID=A0A1I8FXR6_9PLAT
DLTICRHTLAGLEFEGVTSEALVYDLNTLVTKRSRCINWSQARRELHQLFNNNISKLAPDWNHSRCRTPPFDHWTVHAFKKSIAMNHRPETECVTQESNKPIYMGNISISKSGKPCLNWADLQNKRLDAHYRNLNANFEYKVFLPEIKNTSKMHNMCRSAVVLYKDRSAQLGWRSDSSLFIDGEEIADIENQPWCLVSGQGGNISKEFCAIHSCANNIQSIYGVMHIKHKPYILSKLLGHESKSEILDCQFGSVKCTSADFDTLHHPYYGACFKFKSERFLRGLTPKQQARRKLNIRLFADDHSYKGQTTPSYEHIKGIVAGPASREELRQAGYYTFILPPGHFPVIGQAHTANTGSHIEFKIAYERNKRVPVKDSNCIVSEQTDDQDSVEYFIPTWSSEGRPIKDRQMDRQNKLTETMDNLDPSYGDVNNLTMKFRNTQETCINDYVLAKFIKRCECLPYFLPIPTKYLKYPWCYQWNKSGTDDYGPAMRRLIKDDACSAELINSLEDISSEGWNHCTVNCEIERYNIQQINKYWPDIFYHGFMTTLQKLLTLKGFPKTVSPELGLSMLFYTHEKARSISTTENASIVQTMQQMIDAARSNLVWITIGSAVEHGLMIEEEISYTANNLLAEMGGALGLWCGISLLTFCELLELAVYVGLAYCKRVADWWNWWRINARATKAEIAATAAAAAAAAKAATGTGGQQGEAAENSVPLNKH